MRAAPRGVNREISILDRANQVRNQTGSRSRIFFVPYDEAYAEGLEDVGRRVPCTKKLRAAIGFHPNMPIDSILGLVIASEGEIEARLRDVGGGLAARGGHEPA
jgi:UDP-glucose 4-epimerase